MCHVGWQKQMQSLVAPPEPATTVTAAISIYKANFTTVLFIRTSKKGVAVVTRAVIMLIAHKICAEFIKTLPFLRRLPDVPVATSRQAIIILQTS